MTGIEISERMLAGPHGPLRVRIYAPETPSGHGLVWAHGGGFAGGDLDMPEADWVSRTFADHGIAVVSVEYGLAPIGTAWAARVGSPVRDGVHYPVAHDEVVFAFRWATDAGIAGGPWTIGGASAGANLATGAALRLGHTGGPVPALVALAYPTLHAVQSAPDVALRALLDANPDADRFQSDTLRGMYENYLGGPVDSAEAYAIPGLATREQLASFPPTIIVNAEADELRVSGEAFARMLRDAAIDIDVSTEPGTQHGHVNRPAEAAASASLDRFAARILALPLSPEGS